MQQAITIWDYLILPIFLFIIYFIARNIKKKLQSDNVSNSFFLSGLTFKIMGGLGVCLIYAYYYVGGGDTIAYFFGANDLIDLLYQDLSLFLSFLLGNNSIENFSHFNGLVNLNGFWTYMYKDTNSFAVIRFTSILSLLGFKTFFGITIIIATLSYIGIWKLFSLFVREFKDIKKSLAFAILFIPSVAFWGSGILKDTYTLSATCWMVYSFYMVFIDKKKIFANVIAIIVMSYILLSIRPFMLYISLISLILMLTHFYLTNVKSAFIRFISLIMILIVFWGGGIFALVTLGEKAGGAFSTIDGMLEKAAVTQQDLSRDYYGENSFNIGTFEPTIEGILAKAPLAINAGLFYPYIWKANNPVMFIAGLENLVLLLLSLYVLLLIIVAIFKIGPRYMLKTLFDHPLVIFSLSYAIPFAFMVGLTTANYGALVRYKIPLVPFYLVSLFIIIHKFNRINVDSQHGDNKVIKQA
ncbi:MAG: hypothetical protein A2033_07845 [Bacteroidetes bacterium GWA2_31_9]|nr:MAG: hypothetical protein A2033_07845 [Bacteroidetes bacterium GWA2_31_9]